MYLFIYNILYNYIPFQKVWKKTFFSKTPIVILIDNGIMSKFHFFPKHSVIFYKIILYVVIYKYYQVKDHYFRL